LETCLFDKVCTPTLRETLRRVGHPKKITASNRRGEGDGEIKTPTLPKTREEWGTQKAWRREPKTKTETETETETETKVETKTKTETKTETKTKTKTKTAEQGESMNRRLDLKHNAFQAYTPTLRETLAKSGAPEKDNGFEP
jgi:hypothetical protein